MQKKKFFFWTKYRSEITIQPTNNNLDYIIDPIFRKINYMFVFLFKNGDNDLGRASGDKYYIQLVEIKVFHAFIGNKTISNQSMKLKQKAYKTLLKCQEVTNIQQKNY